MTAPCRCQDLRRALLDLWRAAKANQFASIHASILGAQDSSDPIAVKRSANKAIDANRALHHSLRRARRLLRETRQTQPPEVKSPVKRVNDDIVAAIESAKSDSDIEELESVLEASLRFLRLQQPKGQRITGTGSILRAVAPGETQCVCSCGNKKKWNEPRCNVCFDHPEPEDTFHGPTEALNRIMEAWFAEDDGVPFGDDPLHKVLESVARERGFGGEDGGGK